MESSAHPQTFSGLRAEDSHRWTEKVELWLTTKGPALTNRQKIAHASGLLRGAAEEYFHSIDLDGIGAGPDDGHGAHADLEVTWQAFKTLLRNKYPVVDRFGSLASQLYNCEQGKEESVEKYLTRMTMLSSKLPGMNMNYKVVAIEKGLHSAIRSRVKEHQCDTMEDLTKWAILAEECEADRRGADRDVMKTVQEIQRDIREDLRKDLRDMIESTQLRSMTEQQASKPREQQSSTTKQSYAEAATATADKTAADNQLHARRLHKHRG